MESVDNSKPVKKYSSSPLKKGEIVDDGIEDKTTEMTATTGGSGMETEMLTIDPEQTLSVLLEFMGKRPNVHYKNCLPKYDEIGPAQVQGWIDNKKIKFD